MLSLNWKSKQVAAMYMSRKLLQDRLNNTQMRNSAHKLCQLAHKKRISLMTVMLLQACMHFRTSLMSRPRIFVLSQSRLDEPLVLQADLRVQQTHAKQVYTRKN